MDVMEFFHLSAGQWQSQRITHHLQFHRAETFAIRLQVKVLAANDPRTVEICTLHQIDPQRAIGGVFVRWDQSPTPDSPEANNLRANNLRANNLGANNLGANNLGANNLGTNIFAIIPDRDHPNQGQMLRERGYGETQPIAGRYAIDAEQGLVLTTEDEGIVAVERFWFVNPNLRLRSSTVERLGQLSSASFYAEIQVQDQDLEPWGQEDWNWQGDALYASFGW